MVHSTFSISNRKIDPTRRRVTAAAVLPDGSPNDNDRVEIGPTDLAFAEWAARGITPPNLEALRSYRLSRLVGELRRRDYAGLLLFDPLNIRYATDTTNMQLWIAHNPCRAAFISADGYVVLWDFHNCDHLSAHLPLVREIRHGASFFYFESGDRVVEHAMRFAEEIDALMRAHGGSNRRLAVDKMEYQGEKSLEALGIEIKDGQEVTEHARSVKDANEINALRCAVAACEAAMWEMKAVIRPGVTEVDMWAELQRGNHIRGGEWIETRILASGPRTNPWFQEAGPRILQDGDILAFDTDLIGPYGYCSDISRTWKVGDQEPTPYEKQLYREALDHIRTNMELLRPGVGFLELSRKAQPLQEKYRHQRYGVVFHGVGLCDEYPAIRYPEDIQSSGYDGVLEVGQALCVEVYFGEVGGPCGIKLEDQVVITETGYENLTTFPFEEAFLR
ncbi:MAG: M24 family metallopeptidase [Rhizobiales bacterium]|nr:M24 family metallopeptidase [Hyphomicrobiales bacterium]